ncbi:MULTISPECIES: hypothetical protein [unclassified Streptomyces]|uniref:hypothetical protein n=1 Tax=unclassified Streptomyces TaxID=2593676 RepID=UPI002E2D2900|nr:hypothetical protein [Streptomyces sp. NBC_00273]
MTAPRRCADRDGSGAETEQAHAYMQTRDAGVRFHEVRNFSDNLERNGGHEGHRDDGARERPGGNAVDWS